MTACFSVPAGWEVEHEQGRVQMADEDMALLDHLRPEDVVPAGRRLKPAQ